MAKKNQAVNAEQFIREWQKADTIDDVCKATSMSPGAASVRASVYRRRHGVPLKVFATKRVHDWESLAKLAKAIGPKE